MGQGQHKEIVENKHLWTPEAVRRKKAALQLLVKLAEVFPYCKEQRQRRSIVIISKNKIITAEEWQGSSFAMVINMIGQNRQFSSLVAKPLVELTNALGEHLICNAQVDPKRRYEYVAAAEKVFKDRETLKARIREMLLLEKNMHQLPPQTAAELMVKIKHHLHSLYGSRMPKEVKHAFKQAQQV